MIDKTFKKRIDNWARYVRWSPSRSGAVIGSAEGRYLPERYPEDSMPRPIPPDEKDGELVDRAVRTLEQQHRFLLKFTYVYPRPAGWVMRKLGRRADSFKDRRIVALYALARVLDSDARAVHNPRHSVEPIDAHVAPVGDVSPKEIEPVE